jgi:hypothetical protein
MGQEITLPRLIRVNNPAYLSGLVLKRVDTDFDYILAVDSVGVYKIYYYTELQESFNKEFFYVEQVFNDSYQGSWKDLMECGVVTLEEYNDHVQATKEKSRAYNEKQALKSFKTILEQYPHFLNNAITKTH